MQCASSHKAEYSPKLGTAIEGNTANAIQAIVATAAVNITVRVSLNLNLLSDDFRNQFSQIHLQSIRSLCNYYA
jgi:hypothetical protein